MCLSTKRNPLSPAFCFTAIMWPAAAPVCARARDKRMYARFSFTNNVSVMYFDVIKELLETTTEGKCKRGAV